MCGLVGMAGDVTHLAKTNVFRDMLDVCQVRGRDSTGVIIVDKKNEYDWVKQIGPPNVLYDSSSYEKRVNRQQVGALIGHTRHATVGNVKIANAHPFDFPDDGICGVHNGTLKAYHTLDGHEYNKVDSEVLYHHLSQNGPADTFSKVEGAFACVWWDDNGKTLNFIRNDERPLWFTWSKDHTMMFWASELWMFGAVSRKIDLWDGGEEKQRYVELPINTLWSFRINAYAKKGEKALVLRAPVKIIPETKKVTYAPPWKGDDWQEGEGGNFFRVPKKDEEKGGGEVSTPFPREKGATPGELLLDDPLPDDTAEDTKTMSISNVGFLTRSAKSSVLERLGLTSKRSKKDTLSLPPSSSPSYPRKNNVVSLPCTQRSTQTSPVRSQKGVSFRSLAGMEYITDNMTGDERLFDVFRKDTDYLCAFCREPWGEDLKKSVGAIINENAALCSSCMQQPKKQNVG